MIFSPESNLRLEFTVSRLEHKGPTLIISNNSVTETLNNLSAGPLIYETKITFPCKFQIFMQGKGPADTVVDQDGNIIKDIFVRLDNINVDGFSCHPVYLHRNIWLETDCGQKIQTNYWGFNGQVNLNFDYPNSFYWSLDCVDNLNGA